MVWIVAAVCALAAIGLGIWAFTTKSDLDDANATIDRQRQQIASSKQMAAESETRLRAFGRRERAAYRRVRRRLVRERAVAAQLERKVENEAAQLEQARRDVANAQSENQREAARLKEQREAAQLAVACSQGAVDAMRHFFDAANPRRGANRAIAQLETIQSECRTAAREA